MTTKIKASMVDADVATQAELDAEAAARAAAILAGNVKLTGDVVQVVNTQTGAVSTGTTTIPWDDTIPQITEGDEYMTLAITPTNASNILVIEVVANVNCSNVNYIIGALFKDAVADGLAAVAVYSEGASRAMQIKLTHRMVAGTTSAITFRFRAGCSGASTVTFNGEVGVRKFGGVMASSINIREIKA